MYTTILVPVDLSHEDVAMRILRLADLLCPETGRIVALHVTPDIPTYVDNYIPATVREDRIGAETEVLDKMIADSGVGRVVSRVLIGAPHTTILDEIAREQPDLVIIGSHKPGIADYLLGSTAARVVRHAPCSVLVDR